MIKIATIDIKLKSYDELVFEITKLNTDIYLKNKEIERLNNIIEEFEKELTNKIEETKNLKDYSKWYVEGYDKAISITHSSHSGIMLETIKSTTIKRYEYLLDKLKELKEGK